MLIFFLKFEWLFCIGIVNLLFVIMLNVYILRFFCLKVVDILLLVVNFYLFCVVIFCVLVSVSLFLE